MTQLIGHPGHWTTHGMGADPGGGGGGGEGSLIHQYIYERGR